jgi:hypothetical protein
VEECLVVELKAVKALDDVHLAQCLSIALGNCVATAPLRSPGKRWCSTILNPEG